MSTVAQASAAPSRLMTKAEVSEALHVSVRTVDRLPIARCKIRGAIRYRPEAVEAYQRSIEQPATAEVAGA